ncbi:exodeoxyribonuclease V subunit alpha [Castellaniella sp. GW247-6E4]|uniref:exodeoxyribonuclease V subunit alpha n=1 Tax=Castellaniella sp. GW247-6E4 TaxID=3140380 RepID=UPI003315619D
MTGGSLDEWGAAGGDRAALWAQVGAWHEAGALRGLDVAFGRFLAERAPEAPDLAVWLAIWCSAQLGHGHVCLDMQALCDAAVDTLALGDARPQGLAAMARALERDGLAACRQALDRSGFAGGGEGAEPLVRRDHRLYLARYWRAERRVRAQIDQRLTVDSGMAADPARARAWLDALFPPTPGGGTDWQKIACATALDHAFCVVTGGPGTGKTTTVVCLLAALQGLAREGGAAELRVCVAAPTGKAAARLNDSIGSALARLRVAAPGFVQPVLAEIPAQAQTLHRLLGSRPDTRGFRHTADHPLPADVLVIDEASMMDLEMMDAVLAALPTGARLILLGDKDQLASVEAGAVLGELCARAERGHYTPARCARIADLTGQDIPAAQRDPHGAALDQAVVMLRSSRRFAVDSGIGRFAVAVNRGAVAAVHALRNDPPADLVFLMPSVADDPRLEALFCGEHRDAGEGAPGGYSAYLHCVDAGPSPQEATPEAVDRWARAVLEARGRFQVLCAVREGPWGAQGLNQRIEAGLRARGWIASGHGEWYSGRPVLVTRNQRELGLANGDMGVALAVPEPGRAGEHQIRIAFARGDGSDEVRWIAPGRVADIETVYALTVHKSQGSEFDEVALVLPERGGPILTRELLYTGATRARRALAVVAPGGAPSVDAAVVRRVRRAGGLLAD